LSETLYVVTVIVGVIFVVSWIMALFDP